MNLLPFILKNGQYNSVQPQGGAIGGKFNELTYSLKKSA